MKKQWVEQGEQRMRSGFSPLDPCVARPSSQHIALVRSLFTCYSHGSMRAALAAVALLGMPEGWSGTALLMDDLL